MHRVTVAGLLAAVLLLAPPASAQAQLRTEIVAHGLSLPIAFVPDPTSATRFFIVQQGGLIRVLENGDLRPTPLLDLSGVVLHNGEQGLLGMAFAPDAAASGRFFVNFTNRAGDIVVARFVRSPANAVTVDPDTRFDLVWRGQQRFIPHPDNGNHNGGNLAFGPDGYLYIGTGDGGSGNDPPNNAQNPLRLLGKMLRIDVNVDTDAFGYRIPPGNPFANLPSTTVLPEIWAFGLRNPWRYTFDDFGAGATGALIVGDVGQGAREEVNYEPFGRGGRNYGWRIREGTIPNEAIDPDEQPAYGPLSEPLFDYERSYGHAVTGGYVYRGSQLPAIYRGRYFVADSGTSRVASVGLSIDPSSGEASVANITEHTAELAGGGSLGGIVSFGRDLLGEIYLVTFAGRVLKIVPDSATLPGAPQTLSASVSGRSVVLQWTPPAAGLAPTAYRLEAGSSSGGTDIVTSGVGLTTSVGVSGVPDGQYYVRIRAERDGAAGPPSNEVLVTVAASCTAPPQAPLSLTQSVTGNTVSLAWAAAAGASGYVVEAGSASGLANLARLPVGAPALVVGAPPGTYFVRVRGTNLCGQGAPSSEVVVTVPSTLAAAAPARSRGGRAASRPR